MTWSSKKSLSGMHMELHALWQINALVLGLKYRRSTDRGDNCNLTMSPGQSSSMPPGTNFPTFGYHRGCTKLRPPLYQWIIFSTSGQYLQRQFFVSFRADIVMQSMLANLQQGHSLPPAPGSANCA